MTDATITTLAIGAITMGAGTLIYFARRLARDSALRSKAPSLDEPFTLMTRRERFCARCNRFVANERHTRWVLCPKCGGKLSDVAIVADAVETAEPATVPDGGRAA